MRRPLTASRAEKRRNQNTNACIRNGQKDMEKLHISRVIVLEGKYDKIKLSSVTDAMMITTEGFGIFKDSEKRALLIRLAKERGLIVLSDSDSAGRLIRSHLRAFIPADRMINLYVPCIKGKERRKTEHSKEGLLGVEGIDADYLRSLLAPYADGNPPPEHEKIDKTDLFRDGFSGGESSSQKREALLEALELPRALSTKALIEAVNLLGGRELYESAKDKMQNNK